jgi:hypothetical protein
MYVRIYLYTDTPQDSEVEMRMEMKRLRERMKVPTAICVFILLFTTTYTLHMCPRSTRGGDADGDMKRLQACGSACRYRYTYLSAYDYLRVHIEHVLLYVSA